jgi:hypothetical protein
MTTAIDILGLGTKTEVQGKCTHESPWTQERAVTVRAMKLRRISKRVLFGQVYLRRLMTRILNTPIRLVGLVHRSTTTESDYHKDRPAYCGRHVVAFIDSLGTGNHIAFSFTGRNSRYRGRLLPHFNIGTASEGDRRQREEN